MSHPLSLDELRCLSKHAAGNVYAKKASAKRAASRRRREGVPAGAYWYRCRVCRCYHVAARHPMGTEYLVWERG